MSDPPHLPAIHRLEQILSTMAVPGSPLRTMLSADRACPPTVPRAVDLSRADRDRIAAQVAQGALRSDRGVVTPTGHGDTEHAEAVLAGVRALVSSSRSRIWFSHATAAILHGAWSYATPALVHVTHVVKPRVSLTAEPTVRRHFTCLPTREQDLIEGVPVTSPERTLVDCLRTLSPEGALVVADSLFRRGADPREVSRIMTASAGKRGMIQARRLLDVCDPRSGSPGETVARLIAIDDGLPRPECQMEVATTSGTRFVDFGWPEIGVGVEFDGAVKYSGGSFGVPIEVLRRQERRHAEIAEAGVELVRLGWDDLADRYDPGASMREAYYRRLGPRRSAAVGRAS
ncbi:hypothetical protein [Isoptericola sediminis]|uniref:Transcriptional regulator, AbiEi antitoxin, Type IV TA system n=1 Tax=Isoptericola sediminis TaxID=2733572 RepID=A0A849K3F6_9MICO|nr:hypothetical protein [Isoptericola sediminis]NNU26569.1 hypothetical protein [Isoptericola sediminis]